MAFSQLPMDHLVDLARQRELILILKEPVKLVLNNAVMLDVNMMLLIILFIVMQENDQETKKELMVIFCELV